jgi:hypothetical protein
VQRNASGTKTRRKATENENEIRDKQTDANKNGASL